MKRTSNQNGTNETIPLIVVRMKRSKQTIQRNQGKKVN